MIKLVYLAKVVLIGDNAISKLIFTLFMEREPTKFIMSHGADFRLKDFSINGVLIKYQVWILNTHDRFKDIRLANYSGSIGGIFTFDINSRESFNNLVTYVEEFWKKNEKGMIPFIIVGSKKSNPDLNDSVPSEVLLKYAKELSEKTKTKNFTIHYKELTTESNINDIFELLGQEIFKFLKNL